MTTLPEARIIHDGLPGQARPSWPGPELRQRLAVLRAGARTAAGYAVGLAPLWAAAALAIALLWSAGLAGSP